MRREQGFYTVRRRTKNTQFIVLLAVLFFMTFSGQANAASLKNQEENYPWTLTARAGAAVFLSEITPDFKLLENEFNHHPGISLDIALGKRFANHWEPGINIQMYKLYGDSENSVFSANGIHGAFKNIQSEIPSEYDNLSSAILGYMRYWFRAFSNGSPGKIRLNPYVEVGGGLNVFDTEMRYQTLPPEGENAVIFKKTENNKGQVLQLSVALGTTVELKNRLKFIASINTELIDYDCVDGVHNYIDGARSHARTIIPRLMAGIVIPLGNGSGGDSDRNNPWSP